MIKLEIIIDNIEYGEIAEKVIPIVLQKLSEKEDRSRLVKILSNVNGLSNKVAKVTLSLLSQDCKDDLAVYFLSDYKEEIVDYANQFIKANQIAIEVSEINIEKI